MGIEYYRTKIRIVVHRKNLQGLHCVSFCRSSQWQRGMEASAVTICYVLERISLEQVFSTTIWTSWSKLFIVQRYCGQEKCQVALAFSAGGLDGSLPQIFSFLQNWGIPSVLSDCTLALFSLLSTMEFRTKNGFPDQEAQRSFTRGKRIETQKWIDYACKKNDNRARYEGWTKPFSTLPQNWKCERHEKTLLWQ